jgi:hypothetical protein
MAQSGLTIARLSIVVPYRDRPEQLARFVPHLNAYFTRDKLDKDIPWRLTIVEQAAGKDFNRGLLKNIGFLLTEAEADYVCFHDVDYLPIWADYRPPDRPTRIVWHGAELAPLFPGSADAITHDYQTFFGGVVLFPTADFRRINGYSNDYWGWGFEDNDAAERCRTEDLAIGFRDGTFEALHHQNAGFDRGGRATPEHVRNAALHAQKKAAMAATRAHREDGLTTARFTVRERHEARDAAGNPIANIARVIVDL